MMQSIEHAAGSIKRVVAFRLKPGMDVLKGIEEICKAENIKNGVILSGIGSLDGAAFCNPVPLKDKKAGCVYGYLLAIRFFGNRHLDVDYISEKYPSGRCGNIGSVLWLFAFFVERAYWLSECSLWQID